ncbi:Lyso-phosphatidylcholine acyltransferase [Coemansia javaensis]|uniref:Tafazzin family protein n=1 Tax=Coemansia javaensis TaxID=2761396 RepID=A0A9W8HEP8_9FUNG|nr:Lyso-phosphatidylcholine acyltransferase [Coemansia javaensis]
MGSTDPADRAAQIIAQLPRGTWQERSFAYWADKQLHAGDRWWRPLSAAVVAAATAAAAAFQAVGFRRVVVEDLHKLTGALQAEPRRAVVTVANHESTIDDPLIWGAMPWRLWAPESTRWTLGAQELLYKNPALNAFFALGQTIPTVRGGGVHQLAVEIALHKLNQGRWVHVFPEARVNQGPALLRFKWGVGRLIMEAERTPVVIPMFFRGTRATMPLGQRVLVPRPRPLAGELRIRVGDPIDFSVQVRDWRAARAAIRDPAAAAQLDCRVRSAIAARLQAAVDGLRAEIEAGAAE